MSKSDDGGLAFPCGSGDLRDPGGMSLRDYFAGQAMTGCGARWMNNTGTLEITARLAYEMADAMLAARSGKEPTRAE